MKSTDNIFERVIKTLIQEGGEDKPLLELSEKNLIVVHHLLPTHLPFFRYLTKNFKNVTLIAIPYSLDLNAKNALINERITVESPPSLSELTNTLRRWILELANSNEKFFIFEVGGYSSEILPDQAPLLTDRLEGVIEDTEHGLRMHEKQALLGKLWWKLVSVARSPLKVAEDALTGDAIVYSLERQLRLLHRTLNLQNVLVMGFGKVGKYLSLSLKARKTNVSVYDVHPYKVLEAYSLGFRIRSREEMIRSADIILGVTGNTSIHGVDFELLKDGVFLASGSSKTIEIDLTYLGENSIEVNKITESVDEYVLPSAKRIYLINRGAPINFIDNAIIGLPLELIWVECMFCFLALSNAAKSGIFSIEDVTLRRIAQGWVDAMIN